MRLIPFLIISSIIFFSNQQVSSSQYTGNWLEDSDPIQHRKLYLHTDMEYYFEGDSVWFKAYYLNGQSNQFVSGLFSLYTELVDNTGRIINRRVFPIDNGVSMGYLSFRDSLEPGNYLLRAYTDFLKNIGEDAFFYKEMKITKVRSSFEMAEDNSVKSQLEIDLAILPEGGHLLSGQMNTLGIKAIDETGRGILLKGEVLDSRGELVASFNTRYKGMDKIYFSPQEGETYHVNLPDFPDYKYELKDIVKEGIKIEFTGELGDELLFLAITNSESFQGEVYYFAIMHMGKVIFYQDFIQKEKVFPIKVNSAALGPGINRFVLLDRQLEPISERLIFSDNFEVNDVTILPDQTEYGTRSRVQLEIFDEEDISGESWSSLSMAVVDESTLSENGPAVNILSWLLIDSELKGNIESPADYFEDDEDMSSENKLNLLMLTQGWSRYFWNAIPGIDIPTDYSEVEGISIKGSVEQVIGSRPVVNGMVELKVYSRDYYISDELRTDENGRFSFDNIFFTDTAAVFIQARNRRDKLTTQPFLDPVFEGSPGISAQFLPAGNIAADFPALLNQQQYFNEKAWRDYILESGSILLEEVSVYEKKREPDDGHFRIYMKPRTSYEPTDRDLSYPNVLEYLQTRTNIGSGGAISFSGGDAHLYLLNGTEVQAEVIMSIPMSDIDVVDVIKHYDIGQIAMYGTRGAGGIISVFTKSGGIDYSDYYIPGTLSEKIIGYSSYREFYSPEYTPENIDSEKPDHRISLYWNPDVITEDGKAFLSFYTSDDRSRYKIFVEGITSKGDICLGTSELVVK